MSKWSDEQAMKACISQVPSELAAYVEFSMGRAAVGHLGRAILDLRERAEKAEHERDGRIDEVRRLRKEVERYMVLVDQAQAANAIADDNFSIERNALQQRCAALEAALRELRGVCPHPDDCAKRTRKCQTCRDIADIDAALSGDTSALRDMLDAAICTVLRKQLNKELEDWSWDDISSVVTSAVLCGKAADL